MAAPRLDALPPELLSEVAGWLPPRSVGHLAATCRAIRDALTGGVSVWEALLPARLREAAAAAAASVATPGAPAAAPPSALAQVQAAASTNGLPVAYNAKGAPSALVTLPMAGAAAPSPGAPGGRSTPAPWEAAWRLALPVAAATVTWAHVIHYWGVRRGGGPAARDALLLHSVWWFDVAAAVRPGVLPGGVYDVAVELVAARVGRGWLRDVRAVVDVLAPPGDAGGDAPPVVVRRVEAGRLATLAAAPVAGAMRAMRAAQGGGDGGSGSSGSDGSDGDSDGGVCCGGGTAGGRPPPPPPPLLTGRPAGWLLGDRKADHLAAHPGQAANGLALPWARVVLAQRLALPPGGGIGVGLACHDTSYLKKDVLFGDVSITPVVQ